MWRARFGLQADAISGDKGQPNTLGTFNALFPRGAYFGPKFALMGRQICWLFSHNFSSILCRT